jgi:hypothetical protein
LREVYISPEFTYMFSLEGAKLRKYRNWTLFWIFWGFERIRVWIWSLSRRTWLEGEEELLALDLPAVMKTTGLRLSKVSS